MRQGLSFLSLRTVVRAKRSCEPCYHLLLVSETVRWGEGVSRELGRLARRSSSTESPSSCAPRGTVHTPLLAQAGRGVESTHARWELICVWGLGC